MFGLRERATGRLKRAALISAPLLLGHGEVVSAGIDIQAIALSAEPAADTTDGSVYSGSFGERPSINDLGDVAFIAGLLGPSQQTTKALYGPSAGAGSALTRLFTTGDPAPGFNDGTTIFDFERGVTINNSGDVAFLAELNPDSPLGLGANAVFGPSAGPGSETTVLVRRNDPNLDFSGNINFLQRSGSQPAINDAGDIAFIATLGLTNVETLYGPNATNTGFVRLASENDAPPSAPAGRQYFQFLEASTILETGEVAFEAILEYRSPTGSRRFEFLAFAASEQGVRQLGPPVRIGDPVPGRDDGAVFSTLTSALSVNNHGDILVFRGFNDGSGETTRGWFGPTAGPGSEFGLLLQTHIPSVVDGEVIEINGTGPSSLNDNGEFAFLGSFVPAATGEGTTGLFVYLNDRLHLVAREGGMFNATPDASAQDLRRVTDIRLSPDGFNDVGQVLFELEFEDGSSGLFLANVPEPGTAIVLAGLGFATLTRRRHSVS